MKNVVRDQDLSNMYAHSYCEKEGVFASWLFQLELGNLCIYMHTNMQIYINTYKQKYLACKDAQTYTQVFRIQGSTLMLPIPIHTYRAFPCFSIFHICISLLPHIESWFPTTSYSFICLVL